MEPMIESLKRPEAYDHPVDSIELLQTHISWVLLTGEYAYKLKKPVDFGFVNFTTLERRQRFCDEEVRLNRRLAADLYLGVRPVYGPPERAALHGTGKPIEWAVQMRQFSQDRLMPAALERGEVKPGDFDQLADTLADFHAAADAARAEDRFGDLASVLDPVNANFAALDRVPEAAGCVAELRAWCDAEFARLRPLFEERKRDRRIRECHGDLHLGNMVFREGRIEVFDCLEFNASLRWVDVLSEIAFLVTDLAERKRPDAAYRVLNRWLERTGDYAGLGTWRWYFVYRALVRAKVAALRLSQGEQSAEERASHHDDVRRYLALAKETVAPRPTGLIVTHGVSGTGKSFVTQSLCEDLGAVRIRSDVERKRLFGTWGQPGKTRLDGDPYRPEISRRLYEDLLPATARDVLQAGFPTIVDATYLRHKDRERMRQVAADANVPFLLLDFQVSPETARARIAERQRAGDDPSDADTRILDCQLEALEPLTGDEAACSIRIGEGADRHAVEKDIRGRLRISS